MAVVESRRNLLLYHSSSSNLATTYQPDHITFYQLKLYELCASLSSRSYRLQQQNLPDQQSHTPKCAETKNKVISKGFHKSIITTTITD
jgi:hypothetical protein